MTGHRRRNPQPGFGTSGSHVRAETFAEALDGTAAGLLDDTEMLLVIVDRLHGLPGTVALADAGPRPEFRTQLRERLLEEAHDLGADGLERRVVPITSRWTQSWGRRNRTRLVSGLAAGVVGLTAVSVAAANSLPGSPFYNLKRDSESLRYAVAGSDEARGKLELGFARTRLHEIDRLTQHDAAWGVAPVSTPQAAGPADTTILATSRNSRVLRLFTDMDAEAAKGSALLALSFKNHPRPGPILAVQQFAKSQEQSLNTLTPRLSGSALSRADHSLVWAKAVVTTAAKVLKNCGSTTCTKESVTQLTGPLAPTPSHPVLPANVTPSASPAQASPSATPSQAAQPPVVVPSTPASTSPQPTQAQPTTAAPTGPGTPAPPTNTGGQPPTTTQPTTPPPTTPTPAPPTTAPPTTPTTGSPSPPPTGGPTSPAPTTVPPTVPPPSAPVLTTDPATTPPPPSAPAPSTGPPATTPPAPSLTPPPPSAPATSSAAPTTTDPVPTTRPPIVCLPPLKLIGIICIRPGRGPIHT